MGFSRMTASLGRIYTEAGIKMENLAQQDTYLSHALAGGLGMKNSGWGHPSAVGNVVGGFLGEVPAYIGDQREKNRTGRIGFGHFAGRHLLGLGGGTIAGMAIGGVVGRSMIRFR